jgi:hypothetical protein
LAGVDLRLKQVKLKVGMHAPDGGRMVAPAMVAFGKECHRIHMPDCESRLELPGIELGADSRNGFMGMEIEMDLSEAHGASFSGNHRNQHSNKLWLPQETLYLFTSFDLFSETVPVGSGCEQHDLALPG